LEEDDMAKSGRLGCQEFPKVMILMMLRASKHLSGI